MSSITLIIISALFPPLFFIKVMEVFPVGVNKGIDNSSLYIIHNQAHFDENLQSRHSEFGPNYSFHASYRTVTYNTSAKIRNSILLL